MKIHITANSCEDSMHWIAEMKESFLNQNPIHVVTDRGSMKLQITKCQVCILEGTTFSEYQLDAESLSWEIQQ